MESDSHELEPIEEYVRILLKLVIRLLLKQPLSWFKILLLMRIQMKRMYIRESLGRKLLLYGIIFSKLRFVV
jgi:hypothetical protein